MVCVDGKCSPNSKIGFDISQTDSQSVVEKSQQPEQPVKVKHLPVSAFFTKEELNRIRTRIPEIDKILSVMGSKRVALLSIYLDDPTDFILGLDDKYIKIINERLAKMEKFDVATLVALFPEQMENPLFADIVELME